MNKDDTKIYKTNTISSTDLERFGGAVKRIREAWDNLPEDMEMHEREMFVEIASRIINLQSKLREPEKDEKSVN